MGHRDGPPLLKEHQNGGKPQQSMESAAGRFSRLDKAVLTLAEALLRPHTPQIPAPQQASRDGGREASRGGSREASRI